MVQIILVIVALIGIIPVAVQILKNKELIKSTLADWTRCGIKVIYFVTSYSKQGNVTLCLYLCGEETSWLYSSTYENHGSYILAMKQIHYDFSHRSYSDRDHSKWTAMDVHSLSKDEIPCVVQLVSENRFRFWLSNEIGEVGIASDSFKFKTELKECLKKCEIKYDKKASKPQNRWKAKDK